MVRVASASMRRYGLPLAVLLVATLGCGGGSSGDSNATEAADVSNGGMDASSGSDGAAGSDIDPIGDVSLDGEDALEIRPSVELSIRLPTSKEIELPLPPDGESQGESAIVSIKNLGTVRAKFAAFELIRAPDALVYSGERLDDSCTYDPTEPVSNAAEESCGEGEYCDQQSRACHRALTPEPPLYIAEGASQYFTFKLTAHELGTLDCPEPPSEDLVSSGRRYCGTLRIQTNAGTGEEFENGQTALHFSVPAE